MATIQAMTKGGEVLEIVGDSHGPFIIHESTCAALIGMDEEQRMWRVSQIGSGVRFPWDFMTKEAAIAFAGEVSPLHDWAAIKCERDAGETTKAKWTGGEPSSAVKQKIKSLALERGGVKPS